MDCLGAMANSKVSLPCISWSTMLDRGIQAACEVELGEKAKEARSPAIYTAP